MPWAIRFERVAGPDVLRFEDLEKRRPGAGEIVFKVVAVSLKGGRQAGKHSTSGRRITVSARNIRPPCAKNGP